MLERLDAQQKLTANQWKITLAATIGDMLDFFDFGLIAFVLAFIVKDWHLTFGQSGMILLASGITAPFGSLLWGWAADKIGRRKAMIGTVLNTSIATGARALTPEHAWIYLVICRLFVGFGVTGMYSVDITIIQEFVPTAKRGWLTGLTTTMLPAGFLLGALLSAFATPYIGWRGLFAVGLLPAFLTLYIRAWVPESPYWLMRMGRFEEARRSLAWALQMDPRDRAAGRGTHSRTHALELAFQISAQHLRRRPDRVEPNGWCRVSALAGDPARDGAADHPSRSIQTGNLDCGGGYRRPVSVLVDIGCMGAAPSGCVQLSYRGAVHVACRLLAQRIRRRRVDVLRHAIAAELLRQRQLLDRRPLHGRAVAGAAARQRHGFRLRHRQPRQVHRPSGSGADCRLVQLRQAGGNARCAASGLSLFRLLVHARRLRFLVYRF